MAVRINKDLCIGCGRCEDACPVEAIAINKETKKAKIDAHLCVECGICINECKKKALTLTKKRMQNMPRKNGTGPAGGTGSGRRGGGRGKGARAGMGRGMGASGDCVCSKCGKTTPHTAGTPCSQIKCPNCGSFMIRK